MEGDCFRTFDRAAPPSLGGAATGEDERRAGLDHGRRFRLCGAPRPGPERPAPRASSRRAMAADGADRTRFA